MCWWESCASVGWGQKPWKRERLLVCWFVLSFAAQVEKKTLQSVEKLFSLAKAKGRGRWVHELGRKKTTRDTKLQQCRCASAAHRRLASADSAKKVRFESRGRDVHGRRRLAFDHWKVCNSRSSLRWEGEELAASVSGSDVRSDAWSSPSEDEHQGLQPTRQTQDIGINADCRHKPCRKEKCDLCFTGEKDGLMFNQFI